MNHSVDVARKILLNWQAFALILGLGLFIYAVRNYFVPDIKHLFQLAPVISIAPISIFSPLIVVAVLIMLAVLVLMAIPVYEKVAVYLARTLTFLIVWVGIPLLFFVLFLARPLQQHYMPKLGYSECGLLHGNPTLWFTDWVKNPVWCVKGKDREWVFEQAKLAAEKSANPASVAKPAAATP